MIVAIEAMDAAGKQTQSKILAERLNAKLISFPDYTTPAGKAILSLLKEDWGCVSCFSNDEHGWRGMGEGQNKRMNALVLQSLMTTNRLERLADIKEWTAAGHNIVFDRYYASGLVYGGLDGLDVDWIKKIQAPLPEPDVWILLDITPEESVKRRPDRRDRYEKTPGFQEKVRKEYLKLFGAEDENWSRTVPGYSARASRWVTNSPRGDNWWIVDGMGPIDEVSYAIRCVVEHP